MLKSAANYGIRGKSSSRCSMRSLPNSPTRKSKVKIKMSENALTNEDDPDNAIQLLREDEGKAVLIPQYMLPKMARGVAIKRREFMKLRKTLIQQQEKFIESYAQLKELENRSGVRCDESMGEVRVVAVTGWPASDLLLLVRDDIEVPVDLKTSGFVGSQVLQQMLLQLETIPKDLTTVFADFKTNRLNLIEMFQNNKCIDWKSKPPPAFEAEIARLNKLLDDSIEAINNKINRTFELAKISWKDREVILKKLKSLQNENMILQNKLDECKKLETEKSEVPPESPPQSVNSSNKISNEQLEKERAACKSLKEMVATAETLLRVARSRISSLERQLKYVNGELEASKKKYRELEQFYRHRESSYGARSKKLREVSKTGEVTIETLSWQRDGLELRVKELREQAELAMQASRAREAEVQSRYEALKAKIAEKEKIKTGADIRVVELESKVMDLEKELQALREHSAKLIELDSKRCGDSIPMKEKEPSERETEVWKELQATRLELFRVEEQLRQSRADKDNFLESLARIAQGGGQGEDAGNLQEKIAVELVNKEQQIIQLKRQVENSKENEKSMKQIISKYENQLAELRIEVGRLRNHECYQNENSNEDLENKLVELSMQVTALNHERSVLLSASACRALMLERYERSADLFGHTIRARNELNALIERKNRESNEENITPEAAKTLSMICSKASNTWTVLRTERAHVMQLEAAMLAQRIHLERNAHVRTLLEYRRSMLEKMVFQILFPSDVRKEVVSTDVANLTSVPTTYPFVNSD